MESALPGPRVSGVRFDDGEIVILAVRQHWSVPATLGGGPTLVLLGFLAVLSGQRATALPSSLSGVLLALAVTPMIAALIRHWARRYVLTDRRVIVRHGRDVRWVALPAVKRVETNAAAGRAGDVVFRSEQGVLVWPRVGDAQAVAETAREAVERYGIG